MFSELDIQTTITVLKLANAKRLPLKVALVQESESLSREAWRKLAIERLETAAKERVKRETLHIGF